MLGRALRDDDERPGAAPVMVIGYTNGAAASMATPLVGASVRLDETPHTIVGVMPEGFAFPVSHRVLGAASADGRRHAIRTPAVSQVFGRLADGFSLAHARAELAVDQAAGNVCPRAGPLHAGDSSAALVPRLELACAPSSSASACCC